MKIQLNVAAISLILLGYSFSPLHSAFAQDVAWNATMAGLISPADCQTFPNSNSIEVPLDYSDNSAGTFRLFYTLNHPLNAALPTMLFVDGGAGAIVSPSRQPNADRVDDRQWNLVSFHIRGSGCSQIPLANSFDRFINIDAATRDIEMLRKQLNLKSWDLVLGESFGSWFAGHYATVFPAAVSKLVEEGVDSPTAFAAKAPKIEVLTVSHARTIWLMVARRERQSLFPQITDEQILSVGEKIAADESSIQFPLAFLATFPSQTADFMGQVKAGLTSPFLKSCDDNYFLALGLAAYEGARPISAAKRDQENAIVVALANAYLPGSASPESLQKAAAILKNGDTGAGPNSTVVYPMMSMRVLSLIGDDETNYMKYEKHPQPTLYVNGDLDSSTPWMIMKEVFKQECQGNECLEVLAGGGGHSGTNLPLSCWSPVLNALNLNGLSKAAEVLRTSAECHAFGQIAVKSN